MPGTLWGQSPQKLVSGGKSPIPLVPFDYWGDRCLASHPGGHRGPHASAVPLGTEQGLHLWKAITASLYAEGGCWLAGARMGTGGA